MKNNQTLKILRQAKALIDQDQYQKAVDIITPIKNNPTAKEWLDKIDKLQLKKAQEHLKHKEYEQAYNLLVSLDHPLAEKWLSKIDKMPVLSLSAERNSLDRTTSSPQEASSISEEKNHKPIKTPKLSVKDIETYDTDLSRMCDNEFWNGDTAQKQEVLTKLRSISISDKRYYAAQVLLIVCLMSDNNFQDAVVICDNILRTITDWPTIYSKRANCHEKLKNYRQADSDYTSQLNLEDGISKWTTHMARGKLRVELQDYDGLADDIKAMRKIAKDVEQKDFRESIEEEAQNLEFDWAIGKADTEEINVLFLAYGNHYSFIHRANEFGRVLMNANQLEDAIAIFSTAINSNHNPSACLFNRSICYSKLNDFSSALNDINAYIDIYKDADPQMFYMKDQWLADAYAKRAIYNEAIGDVQAVQRDVQLAKKHGHPTIEYNNPQSLSKFIQHYWLAIAWITLAIVTSILYFSIAQNASAPIIMTYAGIAIFRAWSLGFSPLALNTESDSGCIFAFIKLIFTIFVYPIMELLFQGMFLFKAYKLWQKGQVVIDEESGKDIRAA